MTALRIDGARVARTRDQVMARIAKTPSFEIVTEEAMATIEAVIMANHDEAFDLYPKDQWYRVQYWKDRLMEAIPENLRGVFSGYFHEYVASNLKGSAAMADDTGYRAADPNIEARALHDAYVAASASLDDSPWRSASYKA